MTLEGSYWTQTRHLYTLMPGDKMIYYCWFADGHYAHVKLVDHIVTDTPTVSLIFPIRSNPEGANKWYTIGMEVNGQRVFADIELRSLDNLTRDVVDEFIRRTGARDIDHYTVCAVLLAMKTLIIVDPANITLAMNQMLRTGEFRKGEFVPASFLELESSY